MSKTLSKILLLLGIVLVVIVFFAFDLDRFLTFEYLKSQRDNLVAEANSNLLFSSLLYVAIYIVVTALSLPGAAILTIAGGAVFGLLHGTILVSFASTIGATLAFLICRFFLRDYVQKKFRDKLTAINEGVKKEGAFYLFTLRLIPAFPFFVINVVMGLTPMSVVTFFLVSQVGMLPGTIVYVNAGTQLGQLESVSGLLSPMLLGSFILLGIFPIIVKKLLNYFKHKNLYANYKKPDRFDYNVVAIGAGAAGLVTSYIAAAVKAKVALIERSKMGGDCLNYGCVPSKALIKSAKVVHYTDRAEDFGLKSIKVDYDFAEVMERVQRIIGKVEPHDSVERYTGLGVDCIQGEAKIRSPWEVEVNGEVITTKNIVVATGAAPFVPNIDGLDQVKYYTSDTIWEIRERPEKLVVLGGGPIGSELTQAFSRLGCKLTQIERGDRILGREDEDVSTLITETFVKEGIDIKTNHSATRCYKKDGKQYIVCDHEGSEVEIEFDALLLAVGRAPRNTGFGLEDLDIAIGTRGTVEVNEYLQTKYPNIYACGDVAGPYQFTHFAAHQAWYCAVNSLFGRFKKFRTDYRVIPRCTYVDPEVAAVGVNEMLAKEQGIDYEVVTYGLDDLDRAIAEDEDRGFVKTLIEPGTDKIIGVTIVGYNAGEYLSEFVTAMKHGLGLNKILGTIHAYPTFAEANKYNAGVWKNMKKPEKLLGYLQKYHAWERG